MWSLINVLFTVRLNGSRIVAGVLRGFDPFMNIVIDEAIEETKTGQKNSIGMVVSDYLDMIVKCSRDGHKKCQVQILLDDVN